jgi:DNA-binding protein YbaB
MVEVTVGGVLEVSVEVEAGVLQVDIGEEAEVLEELTVAAITAARKDIGRTNV